VSRAVFAIARLTLREALRSRVVLVFGFLLVAVAGGLPHLLKGDGTPSGLVRMTLGYTLGTAFGLLALATLWTGCALVSGDIATRTLELTRVKPVSPGQFWLGKWLGLLLLVVLLLAGIYLLTGATVFRQLRQHPEATAVMRTARLKVKPVLPGLDSQIDYYFKQSHGPEKSPEEQRELRRQLRREIPFQAATLQRGQSWNWNFALDRPPLTRQPLWLRFQFDTDAYTRAEVKARCRLTGTTSGTSVDFTLDDFSTRVIELPVAADTFGADTAFKLNMQHTGGEATGPLLLQPRQGLDLLVPRSGLAFNLLRAATIHLSILALLAAIGITLGTLFSLPVAAFCATGMLLATMISVFVASDPDSLSDLEADDPASIRHSITAVALRTTQLLMAAAQPAIEPAPLQQLAAAEQIPPHTMQRSLLFNALLLPLCCCAVAAAALRRKELSA
jgi:hypothetical protein